MCRARMRFPVAAKIALHTDAARADAGAIGAWPTMTGAAGAAAGPERRPRPGRLRHDPHAPPVPARVDRKEVDRVRVVPHFGATTRQVDVAWCAEQLEQ